VRGILQAVQRIVDLIAQISDSGPDMTGLAAADVALAALVTHFPGLGSLLLERDTRHPDTVRVIAGDAVPACWHARKIPLVEVPFIAECLRTPQQVIECTALLTRRPDVEDNGGPVELVCGAVPAPQESTLVLVVFGSTEYKSEERVAAVEVVRRLLGWSVPASSDRSRVLAAIVEAKQEWERTADALAELVGLVDRDRRVLRINRALERWSLGTVREVIGRDVHDVLHPRCPHARCDLNLLLEGAFEKLGVAPSATFEISDPVCEMDLLVVLNTTESSGGTWKNAALIVYNVTSLRRAERELKLLNRALEQRVADRTARLTGINRELREEIARRRSAEESLRDSKVELEALSDRLVNAQEEERKRIAQDLHDSVGQGMSAIKYSLERASLLARREEPDQAVRVVDIAIERTQDVIDEVRAISMNLRPAVLDHLGAVSAIRSFCRDWREVYNTVAVHSDIAVTDQDIPSSIVTSVYRAVQESLNNVARHAQARRVWVTMRINSGRLVVRIRDDGVGFQPRGQLTLLGLRGLRERTERSGGCCKVTSAPGKGTTVRLEWPIGSGLPLWDLSPRLQ
jgi:signal transduction histidine kinase